MSTVISKEMIFKNTEFTTQEEVFGFLANRMKETNRSINVEDIIKGFYHREEEFSTYIGNQIAIPHCRNKSVIYASVAIIINKKGIPWTDQEEMPDMIFALMIPEQKEDQIHIKILAQVAQLLMDDDFVEKIRNAKTEEEIYEFVKIVNQESTNLKE